MNTLVSLLLLLASGSFQDAYSAGGQAVSGGDYPAAIRSYRQILDAGVVDPVVYYNLGVAQFRNGSIGQAIACFEAALHEDPNFVAAKDNLEKSLEKTQRNLSRPLASDWQQALLFWHDSIPPSVNRWIAGGMWVLFWSLLALWVWRPLRYLRLCIAMVGLLVLVTAASAWVKSHPSVLAVASRPEVPVFFGKNPDEPPRFMLYEGDRARVERDAENWLLVVTADGQRGWAQRDRFSLVGKNLQLPAMEAADPAAKQPESAPPNAAGK